MHKGNVVKEQWKHGEIPGQKARRRKVPGLCYQCSMFPPGRQEIYDPYTHHASCHAYHRLCDRLLDDSIGRDALTKDELNIIKCLFSDSRRNFLAKAVPDSPS